MSVVHIHYVKRDILKIQESSKTVVLSPPLCTKNDSCGRTSESSETTILYTNVCVKEEKVPDSFVDHIYNASSAQCKKRIGSSVTPTGTPEKVPCKVKKESELVTFKTFNFPSKRGIETQDSGRSTSLLVNDIISETTKHVIETGTKKNDLQPKAKKRVASDIKTTIAGIETRTTTDLHESNEVISTNNFIPTNSKSCETISNLYMDGVPQRNGTCLNSELNKIPVSQHNDPVENAGYQTSGDSISLGTSSASKPRFFCFGCGKTFNKKNRRRCHVLKHHSSNTTLIESLKTPELFTCEFCFRQFNNQNDFKHHLQKQHTGMETMFTCPICKEKYDNKHILAHFEESHQIKLEAEVLYGDSYVEFLNYCSCTVVDNDSNKTVINPTINSNYIYMNEDSLNPAECVAEQNLPKKSLGARAYNCPICNERFTVSKIHGHFADEHEIELETEILESECYEDFLLWKKDIENTTKSRFNKRRTTVIKNKNFVIHHFRCHRSGHFMPKGRNSKKINSYCPASLKVMQYKNGRCAVHFQTTHVGHTDDLEHLELTKRKKLARRRKQRQLKKNASKHGELQDLSVVANVCNGTSSICSIDSENSSMIPTDCVEPQSTLDKAVCYKALESGNVSVTNNSNENYTHNLCHACGKSYKYKSNLRSHIRKHHPKDTALIEALRVRKVRSLNDKCMVCLACGKSFSRQFYFNHHVLKFHPNETSLIESLQMQKIYNCEKCSKSFPNERQYKRHVRIEHLGIEYSYTCPICRERVNKTLMLPHFQEAHDIKLETDLLEAENYEDFLMWKENMERLTRSQFTKRYNSSKSEEYIIHYFLCHRSGNFKYSGRGDRSSRARRSKKINSYCPASLKVLHYNDGRCFIKYQKTHVGHTNEVEHLRLTKSERELLASKIAANIPFETILHEVRSSYSKDALSRLHLLTRRDLQYVKRSLCHYLKPESSNAVDILHTNIVKQSNIDIPQKSISLTNLSSDKNVEKYLHYPKSEIDSVNILHTNECKAGKMNIT